jgi:hypothetical protein
MAAANFSFCAMIQQLGLRGRVPVQRADRDIRPVGDLLRRDPADAAFGEQLAGCAHDAPALVLLGPLPAPDRMRPRPTATSLDKNYESSHN